ncbi:MAG: formylglycine-generating enzyme family protein [Verrucomicrobia bacterium]|nr:formylglycine-generating enzyme family protein [Verrucomicrobiota bacterium]MBU1735029.1 formylglycine-generating enzyme family protein [Verrucomicrobiota bacterium]MBU1856033.1 formylglycine-generating enzyme family protein [Verrucomicrobiota bacterium]
MKTLLSRIAGLILLMASAVPLSAQTNVFPMPAMNRPAKPVAPAVAPKPGWALVINLGDDKFLPFVWIGPLKMWVGKFEVTNGQYNRFDLGHESQTYYGHIFNEPDQPVVWVSWEEANNYCEWLTRTFGRQIPRGYIFRLPTEKEWQTFAACGDRRRYPWGNTWPPPDTFNYRGKEGIGLIYRLFQYESYISGHDDGVVVTCPVKRSGGNAWGLFGVGGNVWEWCQDWFDDQQVTRSLRGASWNNNEPDIIAITNRSDAYPMRRNPMIGFRVVLAPAD